jgi:hypothetical protein
MRLAGVAGIGIAALLLLVVPGEPGVRRSQPLTPSAVIGHVKRELGPRAELLGITCSGDSGNVRYRDGNGAAGYQWRPGSNGLEPVRVVLVGDGTLAIDPTTGRPHWTIATRKNGRAKQFTASSNGTRVKRSGYRQRT